MEKALENTPTVPFRRPPGIRSVLINAKTGARANPGDSNVIWEVFKAGTEPTDTMYILDEGGIRELPYYSDDYYESSYDEGQYPGGTTPASSYNPDAPYTPPPRQQPPSVNTGTGGIY